METIQSNFRCTHDALYEGCDQLAINLFEELVLMAGFKAKYTATFIDDFKLKIKQARELPDEDQRTTQHELQRIELVKLTNKKVRKVLNSLRLYIRDAYNDPDVRRVKLQDAGFNDYEAAMNYNWEKLRSFLQKAVTFITANTADLEAGDNMPAGFGALVAGYRDDVATLVPEFLNEKENTPQATQAKTVASNALYALAIDICEDGQHVFEDDPAKQKQFVWDAIMEIVTPTGKAGLKFDVKEQGTNLPLAGVTAKLQKEGDVEISTTTDAEGKGKFDNMAAGFYTGKLLLNDFVSLEFELEITAGVTSFKHWVMVRV